MNQSDQQQLLHPLLNAPFILLLSKLFKLDILYKSKRTIPCVIPVGKKTCMLYDGASKKCRGYLHKREALPKGESITSARASSLTYMITEGLAAADARPVSQMIFGMIYQSSSRGRFMVCAQRIRCWRERSKTSKYGSSPHRTIPPDSEPLLENIGELTTAI